MTLPVDLDWAMEHGWLEASILALLRRNEVLRYSAFMSTASALTRLYPIYSIKGFTRGLTTLYEQGYLNMRTQSVRGKYPFKIYSLTDKAWREYSFGE